MAHYILNTADRERAVELVRAGMWDVDADEPHRDALAAGDLVLIYVGPPAWEFIGCAELGSAVASGRVALADVVEWDPPVAMELVLARLGPSETARAEFDVGVVLITAHEYETVRHVRAGQ